MVGELLDRPLLLGGTNVAETDEIEIVAVVRTDHGLAAFVAGADDRRLDRGLVPHLLVAEVKGAQGRAAAAALSTSRRDIPSARLRIVAAQHALFWSQVCHLSLLMDRVRRIRLINGSEGSFPL